MANEISKASTDSRFRTAMKPSRGLPAAPPPLLWLLVPLLLFAVFAVDVWTPDGLALPLYYVAGLALVVALPGGRQTILAAATCTLLMFFDYFSSPTLPGVPNWVYLFNHSLVVVMIWTL